MSKSYIIHILLLATATATATYGNGKWYRHITCYILHVLMIEEIVYRTNTKTKIVPVRYALHAVFIARSSASATNCAFLVFTAVTRFRSCLASNFDATTASVIKVLLCATAAKRLCALSP